MACEMGTKVWISNENLKIRGRRMLKGVRKRKRPKIKWNRMYKEGNIKGGV